MAWDLVKGGKNGLLQEYMHWGQKGLNPPIIHMSLPSQVELLNPPCL